MEPYPSQPGEKEKDAVLITVDVWRQDFAADFKYSRVHRMPEIERRHS